MSRLGTVGPIVTGGGLLLCSVALAFLMVLRLLPSTWALNFLAYSLGTLGLGIGIMGIANLVATRHRDRDGE